MKGSLFLGQVAKIKVFVHWTFSILLVYILFSGISAGLTVQAIGWHILFILSVFACILLHEFGHALVGSRFGYKTKDIILLPIGGVARFEKLPESPKQEFLISIAGPIVNFIIAIILFFAMQVRSEDILELDLTSVNPENFLILLFVFNLLLGLFNLIPAFPMDGGRVFRALLSNFLPRPRATEIAAIVGSVLAFILIIIGIFYNPFLILIGAFIIFSASTESSIVNVMEVLGDHTAGDLVMHKFDMLDENMTVAEASERILDGPSIYFAIISSQKDIVGTISRDQIVTSFKSSDLTMPLSKIMTPLSKMISSNTPLKDLYTDEILKKNNLVPVTENGQIIGMINLENIIEFVAFKKAKPEWWNSIKRNLTT
jgi:Zn-dependent protease